MGDYIFHIDFIGKDRDIDDLYTALNTIRTEGGDIMKSIGVSDDVIKKYRLTPRRPDGSPGYTYDLKYWDKTAHRLMIDGHGQGHPNIEAFLLINGMMKHPAKLDFWYQYVYGEEEKLRELVTSNIPNGWRYVARLKRPHSDVIDEIGFTSEHSLVYWLGDRYGVPASCPESYITVINKDTEIASITKQRLFRTFHEGKYTITKLNKLLGSMGFDEIK